MDRSYVLWRTLETIYDVTGYTLDEESVLDFDSRYHLEGIMYKLMGEFGIIDERPPYPYTVKELVDYICECLGIYLTRDEVKERVKQSVSKFRKSLESSLECELSDEEISVFVDVDELVEWLIREVLRT